MAGSALAPGQAEIRQLFITRGSVSLTLAAAHDPDAYYHTRRGLYVWDGFRSRVVAKAKRCEAGAMFAVKVAQLRRRAAEAEIEAALPKAHVFDESAACAIIAEMIGEQSNGKPGDLLLYTTCCVVFVAWGTVSRTWSVLTWDRCGGYEWDAGLRVLAAAN